MRILGLTGEYSGATGCIVEMSGEEISKVLGSRYGNQPKRLSVGQIVEVHKTWDLLLGIRDHHHEFLAAKRKLEAVASILELPQSFIDIAEQVKTVE